MNILKKILKSGNCSTIHFIETSSSLLYDAPYINTTVSNKLYLVTSVHILYKFILQALQIKKDAERTLKNHSFCVVELVYGLQGIDYTCYMLILYYLSIVKFADVIGKQ